ncbi:MAG TPA: hypothetical protein VKM94_25300 [Blastocatellia bacterium]|nr:hypothetical protein [Blastocatellia bacterium]
MPSFLSNKNARANNGGMKSRSGEEGGWALLGLILALSVMAILFSSAIIPNVRMQVQRDKELELVFRGEQMAIGIARYYGRGAANPLQLLVPPEYGYLTDLKKLRDGITIGTRDIKFVRPSAFIDPMSNVEWEPVRARDPRIMKVLQAYAAETGIVIPQQYLLIAGPPQKLHLAKIPGTSPDSQAGPPGSGGAAGAQPQQPPQQGVQIPGPGGTRGGQQGPPGQPGKKPKVQPNADADDDDDDDDDDDENFADPLAHLFSNDTPGRSNAPIIGVAPKLKGKAIKPLYGLDKYEDWVFMYMPRLIQPGVNQGTRPIPNAPGVPPPPPPAGGTPNRPLN